MTEKLFYKDSHIKEFESVVISCSEGKNGFKTELECTAFFPEGGGQPGDTGTLGDVRVLDTVENGGRIFHITEKPMPVGMCVTGKIDWERRFRLMQNHSGEHIVSGIVHSMLGYSNVGFHMGGEYVTVDFDGELTQEQLRQIERDANRAVCENREVRVYYPTAQELVDFDYRSKLDITENVRLVEVDGYDLCACCAPHVKKTGEIGMIKLLDAMRHRGGMRINMLCGFDALDDYNVKYSNILKISAALSAKQHETAQAVERLKNENAALKSECAAAKRSLLKMKISSVEASDGNICVFEEGLSPVELRELANLGMERSGKIFAAFSGSDEAGYSYAIGSRSVDVKAAAREINAAVNGRGGGTAEMIQGSAKASKRVIEDYFSGKTDF